MLDLTGQTSIKVDYSVDALTGYATLKFKDESNFEIGSLSIEEVRMRPLMQALTTVLEDLFPVGSPAQKRRIIFDKTAKTGEIFFG